MKDFAQKSRVNYNLKAENYDKTFDGKFTERFKELLLDEILIEVNENILDVACGNGSLLKMISNKCDIKGYGIDISEKMIEYAERKCPDMTFQVSGCEDTSFNNQMFDVITVCAAYHHFPDVKAFSKEAYRILKPHGRLYIAEVYIHFLFAYSVIHLSLCQKQEMLNSILPKRYKVILKHMVLNRIDIREKDTFRL